MKNLFNLILIFSLLFISCSDGDDPITVRNTTSSENESESNTDNNSSGNSDSTTQNDSSTKINQPMIPLFILKMVFVMSMPIGLEQEINSLTYKAVDNSTIENEISLGNNSIMHHSSDKYVRFV